MGLYALNLQHVLRDPNSNLFVGVWIQEMRRACEGPGCLVYKRDAYPERGAAIFENGHCANEIVRRMQPRYFIPQQVLVQRTSPSTGIVLGALRQSETPEPVSLRDVPVHITGQDVVAIAKGSTNEKVREFVDWDRPANESRPADTHTWLRTLDELAVLEAV